MTKIPIKIILIKMNCFKTKNQQSINVGVLPII